MIDQNKLNELFLKAKNAPHTSVFNESKEQFLSELNGIVGSTTSTKSHRTKLKQGIIMLIVAGAIAVACLLISEDKKENNLPEESNTEIELVNSTKEEEPDKKGRTNSTWNKDASSVIELIENDADSLTFEVKRDSIKTERKSQNSTRKKKSEGNDKNTTRFVFPKLTEKEISDNNKRKKKMIKALTKKDKKTYSYVPSSSFIYNSKSTSVAGFHIQRTEVTNLEYKTFLFDLLIQERKDDFLVAKPKQELWTEELGADYAFMQETYFSGEEYENHPVNNISRKGAEMYCDWITVEANKVNQSSGKELINNVRIPMKVEWVKAATYDGKLDNYAWEDSVSPVFFQANFSMEDYDVPKIFNKKTKQEIKMGDSTAISTGAFLFGKKQALVKVTSYGYNEFELYNVCGNVAEMVYDSSDGSFKSSSLKPGTAGGGWMDSSDEIKLNAEDKYEGVVDEHLNIGFRVVVTRFQPRSK